MRHRESGVRNPPHVGWHCAPIGRPPIVPIPVQTPRERLSNAFIPRRRLNKKVILHKSFVNTSAFTAISTDSDNCVSFQPHFCPAPVLRAFSACVNYPSTSPHRIFFPIFIPFTRY
jgi:hypothetical protein